MQFTAHAYLVRDDSPARLLALLQADGLVVQGNPDVYVREYGQFGIDDAHEFTTRAQTRAMGERGRTFVISATSMTTEAQNALLKTIEEPASGARFFFVLPTPETLLPTVRSRTQTHSFDTEGGQGSKKIASDFLAALPAKRLDLLKPFLEKGDDEKRDVGAIISFLSSLERELASRPLSEAQEGLRALYRVRRYIGDKGALVKPLLESVALLVPRS